MDTLIVYCKKALEMGVDGAKVIHPRSILTAEWVRMKCQFGCPNHSMRLCCPPRTPSPEKTQKVIDSYQKAILLHKKLKEGGRGKGLMGFRGFNAVVVRLEIEIFLDGYYKALGLGSGPCTLCKTCDTSGTCKNPERARPAMEACGIDVFQTARAHGLPIRVLRSHSEERDIYGVILIE